MRRSGIGAPLRLPQRTILRDWPGRVNPASTRAPGFSGVCWTRFRSQPLDVLAIPALSPLAPPAA